MKALPCKFCQTSGYLMAKYDSETGKGWVHCDGCGSVSPPVDLAKGDSFITKAWNDLQ